MSNLSRTWVDSESFPLLPGDGYRVLSKEKIYIWKKWKWIFGKWNVRARTENEVVVLDEAWVR